MSSLVRERNASNQAFEPLALEPLALERDAMAWPPGGWEQGDVWPRDPDDARRGAVAPSERSATTMVKGAARDFLETSVYTLLIFLAIQFVVQPYRVEGSSMEPNMHNGQYLLVDKLVSRGLSEPKRGDIIVFREWEGGRDFVKRVVGLPGEQVEVREPYVFVNGKRLEEPYLNQPTAGHYGPMTLSAGTYYVLGDNRGNSSDSRINGPLSKDHIVGRAWFSYNLPDQVSRFSDLIRAKVLHQ